MIGKKSFRPRAKVLLVHRSAIGDFDKVRWRFPWLELIWADGGYNAWQVDAAVARVPPGDRQAEGRHEGLRRPATPLGSRAHLSWFGRNWRLAKDFENLAETLATFVTLASIQLALRRLAGE